MVDQSSIVRFIEDNWDLQRIGNGSSDVHAGLLNGLFDFDNKGDKDGHNARTLILSPTTGQVLDKDDR